MVERAQRGRPRQLYWQPNPPVGLHHLVRLPQLVVELHDLLQGLEAPLGGGGMGQQRGRG